MKWIWITITGAIIIFGIIYYMNKVAPEPVKGLTVGGEDVEVTKPVDVTPSDSKFEPLDLSQNKGNIFVKEAFIY